MIKNALFFVIIAAVGLAIWRIWGSGGNIGEFFNMIWGFIYAVIDGVAQALETAWKTIFGGAQ